MWWEPLWSSAGSHKKLKSHMKSRVKSKVLAGHTCIGVGFSAGEVSSTWTRWGSYWLSPQGSPPEAGPDNRRAPREDPDPWSRFLPPRGCEKVMKRFFPHINLSLCILTDARKSYWYTWSVIFKQNNSPTWQWMMRSHGSTLSTRANTPWWQTCSSGLKKRVVINHI